MILQQWKVCIVYKCKQPLDHIFMCETKKVGEALNLAAVKFRTTDGFNGILGIWHIGDVDYFRPCKIRDVDRINAIERGMCIAAEETEGQRIWHCSNVNTGKQAVNKDLRTAIDEVV